MRRQFHFLAILFFILFFLQCLGASVPIEGLFLLLFGWIGYLAKTLPQVTVHWPSVLWAVLVFLLLSVGLHRFCRWFYTAMMHPEGEASPAFTWPKRWTVALVGLVMTMFIAGIALVGITHQIAWMATSEESLVFVSRIPAPRTSSMNNQRNFVLSAHYFASKENQLPPGATLTPDGTPLHGWPVSLLPHLDMTAIHRAINKDLPWDHPDNKEYVSLPIRVFHSPGYDKSAQENSEGYGTIHYAANSHVLFPGSRTRMEDITDGPSNTLLFGEVAQQFQAWGSPFNLRDPTLGLNQSPHGFGSPWQGVTYFSFADGRVEGLSDNIDPHVLHALTTPRGGEEVNNSDY